MFVYQPNLITLEFKNEKGTDALSWKSQGLYIVLNLSHYILPS